VRHGRCCALHEFGDELWVATVLQQGAGQAERGDVEPVVNEGGAGNLDTGLGGVGDDLSFRQDVEPWDGKNEVVAEEVSEVQPWLWSRPPRRRTISGALNKPSVVIGEQML
jgi:hypothetical protein